MSQTLAWPEPKTFITPARARLVRIDIDTDRSYAQMAGELDPQQDRRSGMGVRVCAGESRPAAGADVTGSLTVRSTGEEDREGPGGARPAPPGTEPLSLPCGICGALPARRLMNGWRCRAHAPEVPTPDPTRTLDALRRKRNLAFRALAAAR